MLSAVGSPIGCYRGTNKKLLRISKNKVILIKIDYGHKTKVEGM